MADVKISALPAATVPLAGTELVPIVQSGVTEQVTVDNLTAGRLVNAANLVVSANTTTDAVRITQTNLTGNALVVEDSTSPDATPFIVDALGKVLAGVGTTSLALNGTIQSAVQGTTISGLTTNSGSASARTHWRLGVADAEVGGIGTSGTSMTFLTNAVTRVTIGETGNIGIGTAGTEPFTIRNLRNVSGATTAYGISQGGQIQSDVTNAVYMNHTAPTTQATAFTLGSVYHYSANSLTIGAGSTVNNQYGFYASSSLTTALTNNYGFYSDIDSGANRWNFYAAGTAANYFAGDMQLDKTVTASGTTGAQTINKNAGTVNFAAAATSLVVTNNRVTANSIIIATVATVDTTMKSVVAVAGAGSFTLTANAAATAETRVNWLVIN